MSTLKAARDQASLAKGVADKAEAARRKAEAEAAASAAALASPLRAPVGVVVEPVPVLNAPPLPFRKCRPHLLLDMITDLSQVTRFLDGGAFRFGFPPL